MLGLHLLYPSVLSFGWLYHTLTLALTFFVRGSNESRYVATARSLGLFVPITVERRQPRWAGQANMGQKLYCHHRDQDRTTENRMPNLSTRLNLNRDWCSKSCYDCTV